eukprot:1462901-Amphidinium_carterae.1
MNQFKNICDRPVIKNGGMVCASFVLSAARAVRSHAGCSLSALHVTDALWRIAPFRHVVKE